MPMAQTTAPCAADEPRGPGSSVAGCRRATWRDRPFPGSRCMRISAFIPARTPNEVPSILRHQSSIDAFMSVACECKKLALSNVHSSSTMPGS